MTARTFRRVVTGLDAQGRSAVVMDGEVPGFGEQKTATARVIWRAALPADNSGSAETAVPYTMDLLNDDGSNFSMVEWPVGMRAYWHTTDTIDYITVISGTITLELEAGEVSVGAGEFIVDRGVSHSWRNDGPGPALATVVTLPALPVGNGKTI